jgi:uncharacterized protein (TIGR00661 family)
MNEVKILYAIQATGNGHLARASDVIPLLKQFGDVDVLVSGTQSELHLPQEPRFRLEGLSFVFGKDGGIDYRDTFFKTVLPQARLRVVQELFSIPIHEYSWVLHDFEPITAWRAQSAKVPTFQLSHQAAFHSPLTPRAQPGSTLTELIFRYAAPSTDHFGIHYEKYDKSILTPIIRQEVRDISPTRGDHYVVYLPSYGSEQIASILNQIPHIEWHVFSKHQRHISQHGNVLISPVHGATFIESLATGAGLLTGAGFQATSEAIFLGKKLLVIPQRGQYEQQCNAVALSRLGVPVLPDLAPRSVSQIEDWLRYSVPLSIEFPDHIEHTVAEIAARMERLIDNPPISENNQQNQRRVAA